MPQAAPHTNPSTAPWYAIRQPTASAQAAATLASGTPQAEAEILIYGDIGPSWWEETVTAGQFVKDLAAVNAQRITIRVASVGGSVPDGIAIYNAIKRHPATITTVVDSMALSIASLIVMAGDEVEMAENAVLMVHAPWTGISGNSTELRQTADMLDTWAAAMATSYAAKTGQDQAAMLALLMDGQDHWYTAAEAQAAGFVDRVGTPSAAAAQAMAAFDTSRFNAAPAHLQALCTPTAAAVTTPVAQATFPQEPSMPQGVTPSAAASNQPAPNQPVAVSSENITAFAPDRATILAEDQARRTAIRAAGQPFMAHDGMADLVAALEADHTVNAAAAGQRILAKLAEGTTPVAGGRVVKTEDEADKRRNAVVASLMVRAGVADEATRRDINANPFRGRTLLALAEASLQAAGVDTRRMGDKRELVAAAFTNTSSDFPILLENTMHKTLLGAYALQALTWQRFCKRGTVSDFRAHNRYRLGSIGNLQAKNELGEYKNVAMPDGEKSSISATTKGLIIGISREAVINDDLGALTDQASAMGRAAARTVEADVYALLLSNSGLGPTMNDGKALFHADHGNIATPAAMSVSAFDAMNVLMASQRDVSGNDFLSIQPDVLLCPIGLRSTALTINAAEFDPSVTNKFQVPNAVRGLFREVVATPRMSGTAYIAMAAADVAAAIEVAFLDGIDTPYLEMETAFNTDGGRYKVRLDYGVAGHDWRGAVRNAGA